MKRLYSLFLALIIATTASAQIQTEVLSPGVFKLTYGATDDYTLYDPGFEVPTFYVHCFVNAVDNSSGNAFEDAWINSNVTMNYDSTAMAYIGIVDLNSKLFTQTNAEIPVGTVVNKLGFVFKDLQNGATKQSADLYANGPTTIINLSAFTPNSKQKSSVVNGQLQTSMKGLLTITLYEISEKLLRNFETKADGNLIDLNIRKNGLYLVKITQGTQSEVLKFTK